MRVLGIDPGTVRLGYGVVDEVGGVVSMVACGVLNVPPKSPVESRLSRLYAEVSAIVDRYQPDEVAIEEPFVAVNVRTALAMGRAQTIAMLAAANHGLPVYRYPPAQVKQQVTAYGGSDKGQVQQMVKLLLGLTEVPSPSDAADALAIALCHLHRCRFPRVVCEGDEEGS